MASSSQLKSAGTAARIAHSKWSNRSTTCPAREHSPATQPLSSRTRQHRTSPSIRNPAQRRSPTELDPALSYYTYHNTGDRERENRETKNMLKQFRDDETALEALANFGADTGNIDLTRRTYEEALENEFNIDSFAPFLRPKHTWYPRTTTAH